MGWPLPDRYYDPTSPPGTDVGSRLAPMPPGAKPRRLEPYVAPAQPLLPRTYARGRTCRTCPAQLSIYNPGRHCGACRCADKDVTP